MGEIAIYARQSRKNDDSISIETQIAKCKDKITKLGYDAESAVVYIDAGKSGGNTERDEFQKLLANISVGKVEKVIVYRLDRLGRNLLDYLNYTETMKANNCVLVSATEDFNSTDKSGNLLTQLLMMFAQEERASIIKRIKDNYYDRIKDGRWPGGPAPYGFVVERINKIPTLVENPKEKPAVEFIFKSYANDLQTSLGMLGKQLFEKGYRSHKRDGGQFDNVTIARILKNTVYVKADKMLYDYLRGQGVNFVNKLEDWDGSHSAHIVNKKPMNDKKGKRSYTPNNEWVAYITNSNGFIDSLTFIKVQERLANNKQIRRANASSKLQEFAGKLKCGNCGYAIKIYNGEQLACYGRSSLHCCDAKFNSRDILIQEMSLDDIRFYVSRKIAEYYSILRFSYEKQKQDYLKLEAQRNELEMQTSRLVKSLALFETESQQKPVTDEIIRIGKQISDIDIKLAEFNSINTLELKENIDYYSLSIEKRKAIINKLINKIEIFDLSAKEKGNNRPYRIVVHWKKEINEDYKKIYMNAMKDSTEEEREKLLMEILFAQPYEEHIKNQEEAKKYVEKLNKKYWKN